MVMVGGKLYVVGDKKVSSVLSVNRIETDFLADFNSNFR